jgi:anti-anti-sigma regulatory factor
MSPSSEATGRRARSAKGDPDPVRRQAEPTTVALPERIDFTAARDLYARLAELKGTGVEIDGRAVVFGGALGAQVLLAASNEWIAAGDALRLTVSAAFRNDLQRLDVLGRFPALIEVE